MTALFPSVDWSRLATWILVAIATGLAVRFSMWWFVDYRFDAGDASSYLWAAHNILEYGVFSYEAGTPPAPGVHRPPLYPAFIAVLFHVFGNNLLAVVLAQIALSIVTALLISRVAAVYKPTAAPWVLGAMMLSPFEAVYTGALLSETLTTFLLVASASAMIMLTGWLRWVIGGILFGLAILCRDIYWPLIVLVGAAWLVAGSGSVRKRWQVAMILLVITFLTVLPWTARNFFVTERFIPVSEGRLGLSLWMGTWAIDAEFTKSDATGTRVYPPQAFRNEEEQRLVAHASASSTDPKESDRIFRKLAMDRIGDEPLAVLGRSIARAPRLWLGTRFEIFNLNAKWFPYGSGSWRLAKSLLWGVNALLLTLGMLGFYLAWRERSAALWLALPIVYTAAVYFPLNSFESRYSQPVFPFVLVFAGIALATIAQWHFRRNTARRLTEQDERS